MYQAQGTSAGKLSFRGVRGHHGAHRWCDLDILSSPDTIGGYRLLAEFSPQPASLTVCLTNSPWERQSQGGTSVQRGDQEWELDELHAVGTLQIGNISDLVESALIFHPNQPDYSCKKHPVQFLSTPFTAVHFLPEAKDHYLIWFTLLSNPLLMFEELYHWPLSYLQVALCIPPC